jgi:hypothetical protein
MTDLEALVVAAYVFADEYPCGVRKVDSRGEAVFVDEAAEACGVSKTQVASRGITICRQNADFETPHATPCRHPERTLASGRGVLEIEALGCQYPNRIVGSTGWVRQVHDPQPCYRVGVSAPRAVRVFVGGRGSLKAHP